MKVVVTREHWEKGKTEAYPLVREAVPGKAVGYGRCCVLAQAFTAAGCSEVRVTHNAVAFDGKGYFRLPKVAVDLVKLFDQTESVEREGGTLDAPTFPIEFELDLSEVTP